MKLFVLLLGFLSAFSPVAFADDADGNPDVVQLPAGSFFRGDLIGVGEADEQPAERKNVDAFSITVTEITRQQYYLFLRDRGDAVMPPGEDQQKLPVVNVTWKDANDFARWLTRRTDKRWRLPSEEEWEYAARSGAFGSYQNDGDEQSVCQFGNVADSAAKEVHDEWVVSNCNDGAAELTAVGNYAPNGFGLYDMHGNAWEWVSTCYGLYGESQGFSRCQRRVMRGGSFKSTADQARLSNREGRDGEEKYDDVGFRLVQD